MARLQANAHQEYPSRKRQRDILCFRADRRATSSSLSAGTICGLAFACGSEQTAGLSQLFAVRSTRCRSLPYQREEGIEWDRKFVFMHSRTRRGCIGCQRTAGKLYSARRQRSCGSAQCGRRCNARTIDPTCTYCCRIKTARLVGLWSPQSGQSSIRGRVTPPAEPATSQKKLRRV